MLNPSSLVFVLIGALSGIVLVVAGIRFLSRRRSAESVTEFVECPECGRANPEGNSICIRCDAPLPPGDGAP